MTLQRPSSKPRAEIERLAAEAIARHGGPALARVYFKYDCAGCDERVTVAEPGVLPHRARCLGCGKWTEIAGGGYMLQARAHEGILWASPNGLYFSPTYAKRFPRATVSVEFER